jgi:hypothetical protein
MSGGRVAGAPYGARRLEVARAWRSRQIPGEGCPWRRVWAVIECLWFACRYEEETSSTPGLALQFDVGVSLTRSFGVGLMVMGNVNGERSFGIFGVELALGGLR